MAINPHTLPRHHTPLLGSSTCASASECGQKSGRKRLNVHTQLHDFHSKKKNSQTIFTQFGLPFLPVNFNTAKLQVKDSASFSIL